MKPTTIDLMPGVKGKDRTALPGEAVQAVEKSKGQKIAFKKMVILGLAGFILTGAGLGIAAYMGFLPLPLPFLSSPEPAEGKPPTPQPTGPMIKVSPLVINLKDERGRHFVKARIVLEVAQADWAEEVHSRLPLLIDLIIMTLSDKRLADLRVPTAKEDIKKELRSKFNQALRGEKIRQIYLDEFIYQ